MFVSHPVRRCSVINANSHSAPRLPSEARGNFFKIIMPSQAAAWDNPKPPCFLHYSEHPPANPCFDPSIPQPATEDKRTVKSPLIGAEAFYKPATGRVPLV